MYSSVTCRLGTVLWMTPTASAAPPSQSYNERPFTRSATCTLLIHPNEPTCTHSPLKGSKKTRNKNEKKVTLLTGPLWIICSPSVALAKLWFSGPSSGALPCFRSVLLPFCGCGLGLGVKSIFICLTLSRGWGLLWCVKQQTLVTLTFRWLLLNNEI